MGMVIKFRILQVFSTCMRDFLSWDDHHILHLTDAFYMYAGFSVIIMVIIFFILHMLSICMQDFLSRE